MAFKATTNEESSFLRIAIAGSSSKPMTVCAWSTFIFILWIGIFCQLLLYDVLLTHKGEGPHRILDCVHCALTISTGALSPIYCIDEYIHVNTFPKITP